MTRIEKLSTAWILGICLIVLSPLTKAQDEPATMTLTLPAYVDNTHLYFHDLLIQSMAGIGIELEIVTLSRHLPYKRLIDMLDKGTISAIWMLENHQRDARYQKVDVNLTNGLIGKRVFFIPKGAQSYYDGIETLDDLRNTGYRAGLGDNWFDARVWEANELPYYGKDGDWRPLYGMLSTQGGVNYFPRGVNEISAEADHNPQLDIEKNLMLVYERDFVFYFNNEQQTGLIEKALERARDKGLIDKLIEKHWKTQLQGLNLENRRVLRLVTPEE